MSNPVIVQVNIEHPVNDFIDSQNHTDEEVEEILDYVSEYVSEMSEEELEDNGVTREEYEQELLEGMPMIAEFHQKAFKDALEEWASLHDMEIEEMVRGYMDDGFGCFRMTHGYVYDWLSDDLYGGNADGKAKNDFEKWAREELGVVFIFE